MPTKPKVIIVTAPSGTGKTTLTRRLVAETKNVSFSVSMTTREKRVGEIDGQHYRFVTRQDFMDRVQKGQMVEWAEVFGNLYGTTKDEISRILNKGDAALLEIDVQGAKNIQAQYPDASAIFIMPPTIDSLWHRLCQRGTDNFEVRKRRLLTAKEELKHAQNFSHFIINDDLERAFAELKNLVIHGKAVSLSYEDGITHCKNLLAEFNKAEWIAKIANQQGQ